MTEAVLESTQNLRTPCDRNQAELQIRWTWVHSSCIGLWELGKLHKALCFLNILNRIRAAEQPAWDSHGVFSQHITHESVALYCQLSWMLTGGS